jgi:group I intron endonuclease
MNIKTRQKYFGESIRLNERLIVHRQKLNNNNHFNILLQNSWNKYGEENFIFFIVEYCEEKDLKYIECNYIEKFGNLDNGLLYNLTKHSVDKFTHSDETKLKLSDSKSKKKYIICLADNSIVKVTSLKKFCKSIKLVYITIIKTDLFQNFNKYNYDIRHNYILKSYDRYDTNIPDILDYDSIDKLKIEREIKAKSINLKSNTTTNIIIDKNDNLFIVNSVANFSKKHNLYDGGLSKTFNETNINKNYHIRGFKVFGRYYGLISFDEKFFREHNKTKIENFLNYFKQKDIYK